MTPRRGPSPGACDSHIHVYDPRFPMSRPGLRGMANASVADYRKVQALNGTTRTIVVQPAAYHTDNAVTVDAVAQLGIDHARGVGVLHPDVEEATLGKLHEGGIRGLRFTQHDPRTAVTTPDMIEPLGRRIHEYGWHAQIHMRGEQLVEHAAIIERLPCARVIDHMGRLPLPEGTRHPAFALIAKWIERGDTWVKLSGAYLNTREGPPGYADASAIARAFVALAPDRLVWGSDWPHPTEAASPPDEARLFALLGEWAGSEAIRRRILVDNPAALYGFH